MTSPDFVGHGPSHPEAMPIVVIYEVSPLEGRTEPVVIRPIEPLIADGDRVAFRYVVEVEDSGIDIKVEGAIIARFREGKLAEAWYIEDSLGMLKQFEKAAETVKRKK